MKVFFNKFDTKIFINSFDQKLEELYEEKKKLDDISKKDFISNCKDFIIEPIANNYQNYGVLSLFFKFILIIQKEFAKKKADNFNIMKEKIINHNQNNINKNNQMIQQTKSKISQMEDKVYPNLNLNKNMEHISALICQGIFETPKPLHKGMMTKNNGILNQNINIEFILNNKKNVIQGSLNMTAEELIEKFKIVLCDDNIIINKYLINNETELIPSSKQTLKELGITSDVKIIVS